MTSNNKRQTYNLRDLEKPTHKKQKAFSNITKLTFHIHVLAESSVPYMVKAATMFLANFLHGRLAEGIIFRYISCEHDKTKYSQPKKSNIDVDYKLTLGIGFGIKFHYPRYHVSDENEPKNFGRTNGLFNTPIQSKGEHV